MKLKVILVLLALGVFMSFIPGKKSPIDFPNHFPKVVYNLNSNQLNSNTIELGRFLFYDPILSADNTVSCASCHSPYNAFAHTDHNVSHGIGDSVGTRNAPALFNLAWHSALQWDGASHHLDAQALAPIEDPREMGESFSNVVDKISEKEHYQSMFKEAFSEEVTGELVLKSLAQFQLSLISASSKYDQFMNQEIEFSEKEEKGHELFIKHCNACHTAPLFTDLTFKNNGLKPDSIFNDWGRYLVTKEPADSLKFKVPSLRNLAYTKPYMHDGRFSSLRQVLNHYTTGVHDSKTLDSELAGSIQLNENEKTELLAFLMTLNDKEFVFNPINKFPQELKNYIK